MLIGIKLLLFILFLAALTPMGVGRADPRAGPVSSTSSMSSLPTGKTKAKKTLYLRLGEKRGIARLVGDFVDRLATDSRLLANPRLKALAAATDRKVVKSRLTGRVCHASQGPCRQVVVVFDGVPGDLRLSPLEWLDAVDDLNRILNENHVPQADQRELVKLLVLAQENPGG